VGLINNSDITRNSTQVVWSPNPDHRIQENATLEFTSDGNLILHDADGSLVWSSGTRGLSVADMEFTELGNLVLFDRMEAIVWQSFDHPTNLMLPGQSLLEGMRLTADTSGTNWSLYQMYMTVLSYGLYAYIESTPPAQLYFSRWAAEKKVTFMNGSFGSITLPAAKYIQFLRLESDGHLRLYEWSDNIREEWTMVSDVMKMFLDDCSFPTACSEYGICTGRQCICPSLSDSSMQYFKPVDGKKANHGCLSHNQISCQEMQHHELLILSDVSYFDTNNIIIDARSRDDCKQACLKNCSCKAVIFRYDSYGKCSWLTNVFTLQQINPETVQYNSSANIKVHLSPSPPNKKVILGATFAVLLLLCWLPLLSLFIIMYKGGGRINKTLMEISILIYCLACQCDFLMKS